jgi:hypothetical protein
MNAVIMDNVIIGDNSIIGSMAFVKEGMKIPPRKVVVGNPARIIKNVTDKMMEWKTNGTRIYQALPAEMHASWKECEPLRTLPPDRIMPPPPIVHETASSAIEQEMFKTWKKTKNNG